MICPTHLQHQDDISPTECHRWNQMSYFEEYSDEVVTDNKSNSKLFICVQKITLCSHLCGSLCVHKTTQKTKKLQLLCGQSCKQVDIQAMRLHNAHNIFNLLIDCQDFKHKKSNSRSSLTFQNQGDVISLNSLYHTRSQLLVDLPLLFFPNSLIRLISRYL